MKTEFKALPNEEAIAYFRGKGFAPAIARFSWKDVWAEEHDRAFTVAKATRDDVLTAIRGELDKAIAGGGTLRDFQRAMGPKLRALGWWGRRTVLDPVTGKFEEAQLGSARRLRIIYDTNLRTANSAGRWARAQRNKALMPFFTYIQIDRESKRKAHKPFHKVTLPVDHPFWRTHWPPNGWQCGCTVRQISKRVMDRDKLALTPEAEVSKISETRPYTNDRTGEIVQVPKGIDPGFERNPGLSRYDPGTGSFDGTPPPPVPGPAASTPATPDLRDDAFKGKGPGEAQLRAAFAEAPDGMLEAIRAMPPLDGFAHRRQKGAVYGRTRTAEGQIKRRIDMSRRFEKGSAEYRAVLRHEYGHALDFEAGGLKINASGGSAFDALKRDGDALAAANESGFRKSRNALVSRIGTSRIEQGIEAEAQRFGFSLDDMRAALGEADLGNRAVTFLAALESRDARVLFGRNGLFPGTPESGAVAMLQDMVGAATNNRVKFRWGHSDAYYRERGATTDAPGPGNAAEGFANWTSVYGSGDPLWTGVMRALVPNLHDAYISLMTDFAKSGR